MVQKLSEQGSGTGYNLPVAIRLTGELKVEHLEDVLQRLVDRHEALRTSFTMSDGELVQVVHDHPDWSMTRLDWRGRESVELSELIQPFDLERAPLFRATLIQEEENVHTLMLDMHHAISDGISIQILLDELTRMYRGETLPKPHIQYKDAAVWQNRIFNSHEIQVQESFWIEQFSKDLSPLQLPTDRPRPASQQFDGDLFHAKVKSGILKKLRELSAEEEVTLYMVLFAAYRILLYRYSGQKDIVVGSPVAGRSHADLERVVGMFVNTLALRYELNPNQTFRSLIRNIREHFLDAYEHADYPFEALVEKLALDRDLSRHPLFDTIFVMQNIEAAKMDWPDLVVEPVDWNWKNARVDLTFSVADQGDELRLSVEYNTSLFNRSTIQRMTENFICLLQELMDHLDCPLTEVAGLSEEERQLLHTFNDTRVSYPKDATLVSLFEEQAARQGDRVAVKRGERVLTYRS